MSGTLQKTPLHAWHEAHGAKLVDFAGWSMPTHYRSIVEEHVATRTACTLFDVSHMGRFVFTGPAACNFLEGLLTRRVTSLGPGAVRYAMITNDHGKVLDDVLVSRFPDPHRYGLVVNASNREKLLRWIEPRLGKYDLQFSDKTADTAMIAVQGPLAISIADAQIRDIVPSELKYYEVGYGRWRDTPLTVSRTGYTGEDGVELTVPRAIAADLWQALIDAIQPQGGGPAGLGARDTLRLEAGMPLYGHELSEELTPFDAGLGFAVQLKDRAFPGSDALRVAKSSPAKSRIGLRLDGKRVPREHYAVFRDESQIGEISSGTYSPTLSQPIAMALVAAKSAGVGDTLTVDLRGKRLSATVVGLPFYTRS
jgi:aminomethyltransferase